jgi:small subunit ribosomal protein S6
MNKYETLLLFSPELADEERAGILDNLQGVISKGDGAVEELDDWGMRDLAYPVRKQTRGRYVRLVHTTPGGLIFELERIIRITDGIFKFVTVKLDDNVQPQEA